MSVEDMVAAAAAKRIEDRRVPLLENLVMNKCEFSAALMEAYLDGLSKGQDLERIRCAGIVRQSPIWPSRANRGKIADLIMKVD